jgi:hypothetical protein
VVRLRDQAFSFPTVIDPFTIICPHKTMMAPYLFDWQILYVQQSATHLVLVMRSTHSVSVRHYALKSFVNMKELSAYLRTRKNRKNWGFGESKVCVQLSKNNTYRTRTHVRAAYYEPTVSFDLFLIDSSLLVVQLRSYLPVRMNEAVVQVGQLNEVPIYFFCFFFTCFF